jgi:hypothetical protein
MQAERSQLHSLPLLLKVAGMALILGIAVDYLTLLFPFNFLNSEWLSNLIDQFVGRGVVPLLGLGLVFLGLWMDDSIHRAGKLLKPLILMAMGLGLMFLLFTPLYFNSNRLVSAAASTRINREAEAAAQQLDRQLAMRQGQINALMKDSQQLAALNTDLQNDQVSAADKAQLTELKATLERVKNDPKLLEQEVTKARNTGIEEIKARQTQAKNEAQEGMRRSRLRITSISLVLAAGYLTIGWTGFGAGGSQPSRRKSRPQKSAPKQKRMRRGKA